MGRTAAQCGPALLTEARGPRHGCAGSTGAARTPDDPPPDAGPRPRRIETDPDVGDTTCEPLRQSVIRDPSPEALGIPRYRVTRRERECLQQFECNPFS